MRKLVISKWRIQYGVYQKYKKRGFRESCCFIYGFLFVLNMHLLEILQKVRKKWTKTSVVLTNSYKFVSDIHLIDFLFIMGQRSYVQSKKWWIQFKKKCFGKPVLLICFFLCVELASSIYSIIVWIRHVEIRK